MGSNSETALLLMDFQQGIVESMTSSGSNEAVKAAARALAHARETRIPAIFVTVEFRPNYVEIAATNKRFAVIKAAGRMKEGDLMSKIVKEVEPATGEPVIVKRRVNALAHTDLRPILTSLGVRHLVLCGLSTSGVILSTVRAAADDDFRLTVLSDACADPDPGVQRVLMDKIFPAQADVITVDAFVSL